MMTGDIHFTITNLGKTPATHVSVVTLELSVGYGPKEISELSRAMEIDRVRPTEEGDSALPNREKPLKFRRTVRLQAGAIGWRGGTEIGAGPAGWLG